MASTFSDLGIELMATGENSGTWGDKTNTNLQIVEKSIAGYVEQAVTSGGTTALTITDGDATESTSVARHAVIKLTGTISGNSIVTVPDSIEKVYIVTNGTSGAYTVQFKTASGTGITFGVSEKTTKLVYSDGTNIVDAGFGGALDIEGRELVLDADGDTTLTADTDDQIDIKIAGADDFQFTANTFTAQSGSSIVVPEGGLTFGSTAITATAAEINLIDGGTSTGTTAVADADGIITNDGGTMRLTTAATFKTYFQTGVSPAADDISAGDAAVTLSTTSGNITIDATANDTDIIFKGTDNSADITMLTLDGSDAGSATFNHDIILGNDSFVQFGDAGEKITGDGTDLTINSSNDLHLTATTDINIPANVGLTFGDDGEKIEGDGTDLVISANNLTIDAAADILLDAAGNEVKIVNAGTELTRFVNNSQNLQMKNPNQDKDITIQGNDGGSNVDALILDMSDAGAATFNDKVTIGDGKLVLNSTAVTSTAAELNLIDGGATVGTTAIADGDGIIHNDNGTMKVTSAATFKTYFQTGVTASGVAADDVSTGDAAVTIATSTGDITVDGPSDIILDADGGDIFFKDDGTTFGSATNTSGNLIIKSGTTTAATFSGANVTLAGTVASGAITSSGTITGFNLDLADDANIRFGNDDEIRLIHVADTGLILKHTATADDKPISLTLQTGETDIAANDVIGKIDFQAPDEATGTDAILVAAGIEAVSEGDFAADNNATKLSFKTAASAAAAETMSLSSVGLLTIADDLVVKSGGTIGGAGDTDLLTLGSAILTVAGEVQMTTLDIGGTNVTSTAAELNIVDGGTSATATTLADADRFVVNDNGTMVQVAGSDLKTYINAPSKGLSIVFAMVFGY
jgi:hypothetical protein